MNDQSWTRVHRLARRPLIWRLVRLAVVVLALGVVAWRVIVGGYGDDSLGPLVAVGFAVPAAFLVGFGLFVARARTVVGPDGIRTRALGTERFLPWTDVENVQVRTLGLMRSVRVLRRDGRELKLTALRDGPAMPDDDFDGTVETIRRQIANHQR